MGKLYSKADFKREVPEDENGYFERKKFKRQLKEVVKNEDK